MDGAGASGEGRGMHKERGPERERGNKRGGMEQSIER